MSHSIHFLSRSIPAGCASPDSGCLPCSGVSRRAVSISPSSQRGDFKFIYDLKFLHPRCVSNLKHSSSACNASYSSNRRNQDFSRQNRFVRDRNRHNDEKESFEELEESETVSSRNGSLLSSTASGNQKFQSSLAPGPREKEIVELFRKVQAQLRGRAVIKEEKKTDEAQDRSKENETVDSLLKLLRKHSVQQGKKNTVAVNKRLDFVLDQQEEIGLSSNEERGGTTIAGDFSVVGIKDEMQESTKPQLSRPKSNFRKKSPVPEVKLQPDYYYSKGSDTNMLKGGNLDSRGKVIDLETEEEDDDIPEVVESDMNPLFPDGNTFDELSEDESDIYEDEQNMVDPGDLSGLKLTELRAMAKSRGMKGFSKLKKSELIELLLSETI